MQWRLSSLEISLRPFLKWNAKSLRRSKQPLTNVPLMISWNAFSFMWKVSLTNMSFLNSWALFLGLMIFSISWGSLLRQETSQEGIIISYASLSQSLRPTTSGRFPTPTSKCPVISRVPSASVGQPMPNMLPFSSRSSMKTIRVYPKAPKTSSLR